MTEKVSALSQFTGILIECFRQKFDFLAHNAVTHFTGVCRHAFCGRPDRFFLPHFHFCE